MNPIPRCTCLHLWAHHYDGGAHCQEAGCDCREYTEPRKPGNPNFHPLSEERTVRITPSAGGCRRTTEESMSDLRDSLTLPGSIPGLLRRGSPVFVGRKREPSVVREINACRGDGNAVGVWNGWLNAAIHLIALDLTDATGRAHAAWWLMGLDYGHVRPLRGIASPFFDLAPAVVLTGHPQDAGWASAKVAGHIIGTIVPSLAGLNPDDPRTLPDGSRWVDAEALRRVCMHAASLEADR